MQIPIRMQIRVWIRIQGLIFCNGDRKGKIFCKKNCYIGIQKVGVLHYKKVKKEVYFSGLVFEIEDEL